MGLRPQVGALFINASGNAARFAALNCTVVADLPYVSAVGPLVSVTAAFAYAQSLGFSRLKG
jgi:molybdopterin-guanine dinucleotide biosynthesis protein A